MTKLREGGESVYVLQGEWVANDKVERIGKAMFRLFFWLSLESKYENQPENG